MKFMTATISRQDHRTRSERSRGIFRYRVMVLEEPPKTLGGFQIFGMEVKLGKGRHVEFSPELRTLEVETTQEPLPMDIEVNAKYQKNEGKTVIVRRRSLLFKIERTDTPSKRF